MNAAIARGIDASDTDRQAILALVGDHATGIRDKDAGRATAGYLPNAVICDLAPPLAHSGPAEEERGGLEAWFATWDGPIGYDIRLEQVTVGGDAAFAHGFLHISGTKTDGQRNAVWARLTVCLVRTPDGWRIAHEHSSVPFYMDGSLRAAVDLSP
ncbi:YybH family protein [Zavarzinia sp. CC-PAN008]|uniref:YybH family protein n=1 Tax=Zavarzinia sp. CC-PAN008 TaxID=3243332 RepID=UPI003F743A9E